MPRPPNMDNKCRQRNGGTSTWMVVCLNADLVKGSYLRKRAILRALQPRLKVPRSSPDQLGRGRWCSGSATRHCRPNRILPQSGQSNRVSPSFPSTPTSLTIAMPFSCPLPPSPAYKGVPSHHRPPPPPLRSRCSNRRWKKMDIKRTPRHRAKRPALRSRRGTMTPEPSGRTTSAPSARGVSPTRKL